MADGITTTLRRLVEEIRKELRVGDDADDNYKGGVDLWQQIHKADSILAGDWVDVLNPITREY